MYFADILLYFYFNMVLNAGLTFVVEYFHIGVKDPSTWGLTQNVSINDHKGAPSTSRNESILWFMTTFRFRNNVLFRYPANSGRVKVKHNHLNEEDLNGCNNQNKWANTSYFHEFSFIVWLDIDPSARIIPQILNMSSWESSSFKLISILRLHLQVSQILGSITTVTITRDRISGSEWNTNMHFSKE